MVQLAILSGQRAGATATACRFPFHIGREHGADFRLEEDGVWDRHLELDLQMPEGFVLTVRPEAQAAVNDQPVRRTLLRNGDLIAIGSVQFRFWLSVTRQGSLRLREILTWVSLAVLCAAQIALIYRLLQ